MCMKTSLVFSLAISLVLAGTVPAGYSQTRQNPASPPKFDILNYDIAVS